MSTSVCLPAEHIGGFVFFFFSLSQEILQIKVLLSFP
jgi:hypothetical protein